MGLNEVLDITDSVNPNAVSICSVDFSFMSNPNGDKKEIYIGIVSNILELSEKRHIIRQSGPYRRSLL